MTFEPSTRPHPNATQFAATAGDAVNRGGSIWLAWLGWKAGKNHYEIEGDLGSAAYRGLGAALRWWIWGSFCALWWFTLALYSFGYFMSQHAVAETGATPGRAVAGIIALLVVSPFMLGVTWCRFIDFGLYRRGLIYRFWKPLARIMEWCPTWVLLFLLLIPWRVA